MTTAKRYWRLIGLVIVAFGMVIAAPDVPAANGSTNPAVAKVQSEAPSDPVTENRLRDPFWPVGYSPVTKMVPVAGATAAAVAPGPVAADLMKRALAMLRVEGIIRRGSKCFATVNGVMVEAGDSIPIMVDDQLMVFIVRSVDMKRIRVEPARK